MALVGPFPGHSELTTFADLRRDLEGAVVRNSAGVVRAGILPAHFNALVTGRSDMRVNIADFRGVQARGGAVFLANVGVDTSVQLDAAPAANRRIDLIYVTMRSATLGDPASTPVFGVVKGTAAPSPTVPSLPANVSDAVRLATVEIPAGATTTLSAGVIITQVYPYTAMVGGTVVVRNSVELAAWTPADGAKAYNLADSNEYVRSGGAWKAPGGSKTLWSGSSTLGNSVTITLSEPISAQPTGIVLVWALTATPTSGVSTDMIPKGLIEAVPSINFRAYMGAGVPGASGLLANVRKMVDVTNTTLTGSASNTDTSPNGTFALIRVLGV